MQPDDRSSLAKGLDWSSRITTIGLTMVLPGICGIWLDEKYSISPACMLVGFALGLCVSGLQLRKLIQTIQADNDLEDDRSQKK